MAYGRIYRGEFVNTLPGVDNAIVEQTVRIDISDTETGSEPGLEFTGVYSGSGLSILLYPPLADMSPDYATRLALFNEWAAFFVDGMVVHIEGLTGGTVEYNVVTASYNPPLPPPAIATPGSITLTTQQTVLSETHEDGITYTSITEAEIIPLEMAGDPFHISTIDNNEDKFTTIRSKQGTIKIHTNTAIDINTFCEGNDEKFKVDAFVDDLLIKTGYLTIPDMQQEFMPNPNELELTSTDNLGILKEQDTTDFENQLPVGDYRIMNWIAWCLKKTGLSLPINIISSVKHGTGNFTASVQFTGTGMFMSNANSRKFYNGGTFTVTGTSSNNVTFTVTQIGESFIGLAAVVTNTTFATEGPVNATFQDDSSTRVWYDKCYLHSTTFEKGIRELENPYTILQKILTEDSVLFQMNGEWWIVRIDDMQGDADYSIERYDAESIYIETITRDGNKNIGEPDIIAFMNDNPALIPDRSLRTAILNYKYSFPLEFICNIELTRGEFIEDLPDEERDSKGDIPEVGNTDRRVYNVKSYTPECWEYKKGAPVLPQDSDGYVKKYFYNGYEKFSWLYAEPTATSLAYYWQSQDLKRMNAGDKFEISIDVKYGDDLGGGGGHFSITQIVVKLYADDGTTWSLHAESGSDMPDPQPRWEEGDFDVILEFLTWEGDAAATRFDQWNTISWMSAPLPRSGRIQVELWNAFDPHARFKQWDNLRIDYLPLVNGSYGKYTGQRYSVSQTTKNKGKRENEVFVSDAPSAAFKGAIKIPNGTDYNLAYLFTDANHSTPAPFGELQIWSVWNQYRLDNRNWDADFDLLESEEVDAGKYNGVDLINKITLTDTNVNTVNRLCMILHYDMDFHLNTWKGYVASLYNTEVGKVYTDFLEFKYITDDGR